MDWNVMRRCRCMRWVAVPLVLGVVRGELRWVVIAAWILAGLVLLPMVAGAMPVEAGEAALDLHWQGVLQVHPEWPTDVRAAVMAGIICAGMPADMVRAAWGSPTRTSGRGGPGQLETWHYEGRPSAVERLGGRGRDDAGASEWTVSFIDGQVIGWTD
jgi:hypothetical protein